MSIRIQKITLKRINEALRGERKIIRTDRRNEKSEPDKKSISSSRDLLQELKVKIMKPAWNACIRN